SLSRWGALAESGRSGFRKPVCGGRAWAAVSYRRPQRPQDAGSMAQPLTRLLRQLRHLSASPEPASDADLIGRFVRRRDEEAFAALVERHGPMVLNACRRVLGDVHAAEDAFQAVFLVLARKAATLSRPEALAGWLYGVACRVALKLR